MQWHAVACRLAGVQKPVACPSTHARSYRLETRNKHRRVRLSFRDRGDSTSRSPQLRPLGGPRSDWQAFRTFRFTTYGTFLYSLERCRSRRCCAACEAGHNPGTKRRYQLGMTDQVRQAVEKTNEKQMADVFMTFGP